MIVVSRRLTLANILLSKNILNSFRHFSKASKHFFKALIQKIKIQIMHFSSIETMVFKISLLCGPLVIANAVFLGTLRLIKSHNLFYQGHLNIGPGLALDPSPLSEGEPLQVPLNKDFFTSIWG